MAQLETDRLVRKEVALGAIREMPRPQDHIGLALFAPMKEVQSDDVIFSYISPEVDGLAPARAEDAESELADKDDTFGTGRASIIDWAIKDHYDASDVTRYREFLRLAELSGGASFPLTVGSMTEDFASKIARDSRIRRRKLDNRLEWLIMQALFVGSITYNDGKIIFSVDYERPANQTAQAPAGTDLWSTEDGDPIGDTESVQDFMWDTHRVKMTRAVTSRKVIRSILNSNRFAARSGVASVGSGVPIDPRYLIDGWGVEAAKAVYERATGVQLIEYDAVYGTRARGSKTPVWNRFSPEDQILFLPSEADLNVLAGESEMGFGKTLTSPHPEGNWSSGFYEWERSTVDPWGQDKGSGIKAFPVFPHLDLTYTLDVL